MSWGISTQQHAEPTARRQQSQQQQVSGINSRVERQKQQLSLEEVSIEKTARFGNGLTKVRPSSFATDTHEAMVDRPRHTPSFALTRARAMADDDDEPKRTLLSLLLAMA